LLIIIQTSVIQCSDPRQNE